MINHCERICSIIITCRQETAHARKRIVCGLYMRGDVQRKDRDSISLILVGGNLKTRFITGSNRWEKKEATEWWFRVPTKNASRPHKHSLHVWEWVQSRMGRTRSRYKREVRTGFFMQAMEKLHLDKTHPRITKENITTTRRVLDGRWMAHAWMRKPTDPKNSVCYRTGLQHMINLLLRTSVSLKRYQKLFSVTYYITGFEGPLSMSSYYGPALIPENLMNSRALFLSQKKGKKKNY